MYNIDDAGRDSIWTVSDSLLNRRAGVGENENDLTPHTPSQEIFNSFSCSQPTNFETLHSTESDDLS